MKDVQLGSRALYPALEDRAYLNHASIAPPNTAVSQAVQGALALYAQKGTRAFNDAAEQRAHLKQQLATLLGCAPDDLALTSSTNQGLTDLSCCIPLQPGDRILGFDREFPANITPWQAATRALGGSFALVEQEGIDDDGVLERLEDALRAAPTRLVAVSAVQFSTGRAMPLAGITQLAHAHGAEVCVDAIQALGVMPLEVRALGVDYLASGAHKWMMGLEGVGFVYVRPERVAALRPRTAGWLSYADPFAFLMEGEGHLDYDKPFRQQADVLEGHSLNAIGCYALGASLAQLLHLGIDQIQAHVRAYNDALEAGLIARGFTSLRPPGSPSGTLAVRPPDGDAVRWQHALGERGVAVAAPDGKLRLAPHWPNPLDEVELVLAQVDAIQRGAAAKEP